MEMGTKTGKGRNAFLRRVFVLMLPMALAAMAGAYVYASFGGEGAYRRWVTFMFEHPLGLGLAGLFVISLVGKAAWEFLRGLRPAIPPGDSVRSMDVFLAIPVQGNGWADTVTGWLTRQGFKKVMADSHSVTGLKGRWSFIPGLICRLGLALLVTAAAVSHNIRQADTAMLTTGIGGSLFGMPVELAELESGVPDSHLQVGKEESFRIKTARASVRINNETATLSSGWPESVSGLWVKITGIGFAQTFIYGGATAETEPLMLQVFPPGRQTRVRIGKSMVKAALSPERTVKKGRLKGDMFNLETPSYKIIPSEGAPIILKGNGGQAEEAAFGIGSRDYWVRIEAVRDPALGMVHLGFIMLGTGLLLLPLNLFWYRKEFLFTRKGDSLVFGYSEQILKKWGAYRFYEWKDEITDLIGADNSGN